MVEYEADFSGWANEQAALLRAGRLGEADVANIADRRQPGAETRLDASVFPPTNPWTLQQVLDEAYRPE